MHSHGLEQARHPWPRRPHRDGRHRDTLVDLGGHILSQGSSAPVHRYAQPWTGLDAPIGGTDKVIQAIRDMSEDPKEQGVADRVLAMLFREANGIAQIASRNSLDTYQQVARRHHLTSADFYQTDHPAMQLDWDRGVQVTEDVA